MELRPKMTKRWDKEVCIPFRCSPQREVVNTSDQWEPVYQFALYARALAEAKDGWKKPDVPIRHSETKRRGELLDQLESCADAGNESGFLKVLQDIPWGICSAEEVIRVIRLALKAGAHGAVQRITIEGLKHHPDHADVQKYARLYGPPKRTDSPNSIRNLNHMANKAWLVAHAGEYRNHWIAVRDGVLLGSAVTLEELIETVGDTKRALVTIGY